MDSRLRTTGFVHRNGFLDGNCRGVSMRRRVMVRSPGYIKHVTMRKQRIIAADADNSSRIMLYVVA